MSYRIADFGPSDILTSPKEVVRRVQVDPGNTGFFDGREFRYFREMTVAANTSAWIRVTVPSEGIIIKEQDIFVDDGAVRFRAWRDLTISGVTWTPPASPTSGLYPNNGLPSAEPWTMQTVIENGGNHTTLSGGTVSEIHRVRSSGATAQRISVGQTNVSERGIPPGVYHLQFEALSGQPTTVIYDLRFEERLGQG